MAKILVAVADSDERRLYIFALRFAGHIILGASNLEEAYTQLSGFRPDLIVLDHQLRGKMASENKFQFFLTPGKKQYDVIYLVNQGEFARELKLKREKMLVKPINIDELVKAVNRALTQHR